MSFIRTLWELPQNILGFIVKSICRTQLYTAYKDATVYYWKIDGGLSLGKYIFLPCDPVLDHYLLKHEYGHTLQSKRLGWLYLLVIGLPSLIWASCFRKYRAKTGKSYYSFYTESWANKLGQEDTKQ